MAKLAKQDIPFTQVANIVLNDKELSFKAKGIFAYLFSKPEGWNFNGDRIAKESCDGRKAVFSGLKELEEKGYLQRIKNSSGRVDYSLKFSQEPVAQKGQEGEKPVAPFGKEPKRQRAEMGSISNIDSESNKEIEKYIAPSAGNAVNEIIFLFKEVNPSIEKFYGNKTQRSSVERMLKTFGRAKVESMIAVLPQLNAKPFWPKSTTPVELENNIGKYKAKSQEERNKVELKKQKVFT